jgi:hypothetical protein
MGSPAKKHAQLVSKATDWLRKRYGCGVVLSEQYCATGEIPDVIGWKRRCRSVVIECKVTRSDFVADAKKPFRTNPEEGLGSERFYLAPPGMIQPDELPKHWGLLECGRGEISVIVKSGKVDLRSAAGFAKEMNLLLASLRRVEIRIEPQTITEFLKWKNRMADYNGGRLPAELIPEEEERNPHLMNLV